ncbi:bacillithiol biosynthesis cysteine-adding enzyme BshC [Aciduricibacillus chroicocephali]|uniref:Putative cysteine ligase BshC n=1 Tax=Aciduricibacillus chroicocephali TaxID=3054939 RepID=A0ABY9KXV4_9BACI|nr:bacillithiol biosynthesis cysteine-adding enzyme BshC [Bacillaceae bacterium 44XB]
MQIEKASLPNLNKLIRDYKNHDTYIMNYFDYEPFSESFDSRLTDLQDRTFDRDELADVLVKANKQWNAPESTFSNIEKLRRNDSVAVVGGQQAGLLTGPLYSINKLISIIQLAKAEEVRTGVPVVPIFWIAGEDHDFDEINHVFMPVEGKMEKIKLAQKPDKKSVSKVAINAEKSRDFLDAVFATLEETEWTKEWYRICMEILEQSDSYVDFFARLIFSIFEEEGVILLDSADPDIRRLESRHFVKMIEKQQNIAASVVRSQSELASKGYHVPLEPAFTDGNLFIEHDGERVLLQVDETGKWVGKQRETVLSTDELLEIARTSPERLSNNVVTRPIMQELLIPTLAFLGGNGEIAYWSALKDAFHVLDLRMPPVLPRLSFTYIDKATMKRINRLSLEKDSIITMGTGKARMNWLRSQISPPVDLMRDELKQTVANAHEPLKDYAQTIRPDIGRLAEKNIRKIEKEIDFLYKRIMLALEEQHSAVLADFDDIELMLHPLGGLQERAWNPVSFLNLHGKDFFKRLAAEELSFQADHYFVYI